MIKNIFTLLIILLFFSACNSPTYKKMTSPLPVWQWGMFDAPPGKKPEDLPALYVEGWQAGCETGVSMYAGKMGREANGWNQDAIKAQNRVYYKGWKDAFDYCGRSSYAANKRKFI